MFLLIYAAASQAVGATLDQDYVRRLTRVHSTAELERAKSEFEDLKVARTACRMQIYASQLPAACYESLDLEIRWGLHPAATDRRRILTRLDNLCEESAAALKIPRDSHILSKISLHCRLNIKRAREIQEYRRTKRG